MGHPLHQHAHHMNMNTHHQPHYKSELCQYFRSTACEHLLEHRRLEREEAPWANRYATWCQYLSMKRAAWEVSTGLWKATVDAPETPSELPVDFGRPAYLKTPVDADSELQDAAEARVHGDGRVNFHD